jgi:hypothetical protein
MKQHRDGQRIINWHRPHDPTRLSQRYLRCQATAWQRDELLEFDDWDHEEGPPDYSRARLYYAYYAARELLDHAAPQGAFWQFFVQRGWPLPQPPHVPEPAAAAPPAAPLAEQLAAYWRQLLNLRDAMEWLPTAAQQAITATDLRSLQAIAATSAQGRAAAIHLLLFRPFWVRSLHSWEPQGACERDQIVRLIAHLLTHYPIPPALYAEWMAELEPERTKWLCWTILIGQGQSLHQAAGHFGWELPRRLPHHLFAAPDQATAREACMYAEVLRLGGSAVEFQRLRLSQPFVIDPTELREDRHFLAFWRSSVLWLIQHRQELSGQQVQVVLAWAMHQYTEALRPRWQRFDEAPQIPGRRFSLTGRSVPSVLEASVAYQRYCANPYAPGWAFGMRWVGHGWDCSWEEAPQGRWSATELTSSEELVAEGQAMHHCVAGYAGYCIAGMSAIVSLCLDGVRRVTVEIHPPTRRVVQARGPYNRSPSAEERAALNRWLRSHCR